MNIRHRILIAVGFALAFVAVFGYQFNNGDQEEHLPYVYKLLDPSLYPNDYLIPRQVSTFTVRFFFAHLLALGGKLIPLDKLVFALHLLSLFVSAYCVSRMAMKRSIWNVAGWVAPVLLLVWNTWTVGGNHLLDVQLTCSSMAMMLGAIALLKFDGDRPVQASAIAGLAALFQVLMGLQLFLLFGLIMLWRKRFFGWKKIVFSGLAFIGCSAAMLGPVMYKQLLTNVPGDNQLYHQVLFIFRNANHYHPLCFPLSDYLKELIVIALLVFCFSRQSKEKNRYVPEFLIFVLLGSIVYSIGFYYEITSLVKLQWFKTNAWLVYYAIVPVSVFISDKLRRNIEVKPVVFGGLFSAIVVGFLMITNSALLPIEKLRSRYKIGNYEKSDLQLLHERIDREIPKTAIVLPMANDESFLCEAKRSIPVGYKAIIHEKDFMLNWYQRMGELYHVSINPGNCNQEVIARSKALQNTQLPLKYKIDYRILDSDLINYDPVVYGEEVFRQGPYILTKVL
jgi:hypothetical protein